MKKAVSVNRLFLGLVVISLSAPFLFSRFWEGLGIYQNLAMTQMIFLIPVLIYIGCTRGDILNDLQLHMPKVSTVLMTFVLASLLTPVMAWLNLFSMLFTENYVAGTMMELYDASLMRNLAYVALLPALSEEFIFRGVFYHSYRPAGVWKAAVLSGFCFGLLHMNLNQFFYGFVLGVVFALLVEASGSLLTSMFLHFLLNANSVYMMELLKELEEFMGTSQLPQAVETMASRKEILAALGGYTLSAVIGGFLAFLALRFIARRNGKGNLFTRECLAGGSPETKQPGGDYEGWRATDRGSSYQGWNAWDSERSGREGWGASGWEETCEDCDHCEGEAQENREAEEKSKKRRKSGGGRRRLLTPSLAAGAAIAVCYMLVINFL